MKITIYELLGLIKDGKAPKKIKYCGNIYEYEEETTHYLTQKKGYKVCLGGEKGEINVFVNAFNENVEILEDKEYEDIEETTGDYIVPNTPATENEAYIMACLIAHEQTLNALIKNQKKIIERLNK